MYSAVQIAAPDFWCAALTAPPVPALPCACGLVVQATVRVRRRWGTPRTGLQNDLADPVGIGLSGPSGRFATAITSTYLQWQTPPPYPLPRQMYSNGLVV